MSDKRTLPIVAGIIIIIAAAAGLTVWYLNSNPRHLDQNISSEDEEALDSMTDEIEGSESADTEQPSNTGLANPASVHCEENGGTVEMRENTAGSYGMCVFPDGTECEEWAYYYDKCDMSTIPEE